MSLFRFELRKLLLNKKTLILLLCLLVLYSVVGLTSTMFLIGSNDSYRAYEKSAANWEGPFDNEKATEAKKIYQEVSARYGADARMISRSVKDQPEVILAVNYHAYAEQGEEYWNGTPPEIAASTVVAALFWLLPFCSVFCPTGVSMAGMPPSSPSPPMLGPCSPGRSGSLPQSGPYGLFLPARYTV